MKWLHLVFLNKFYSISVLAFQSISPSSKTHLTRAFIMTVGFLRMDFQQWVPLNETLPNKQNSKRTAPGTMQTEEEERMEMKGRGKKMEKNKKIAFLKLT